MRDLNEITGQIIGCSIKIHRKIGPGLLESAYEACLAPELNQCGVQVERQKPLPLVYEGIRLDCGYRLDLLVERSVVVEIKAVDILLAIHHAQLISYLKLSNCKVGLLLSFNVTNLRNRIRRVVNSYPETQRPQRPLR